MLLPQSTPGQHSLFIAQWPQGHSWPYLRFPWFIITTWQRFFFMYCPKVQKGMSSGHLLGNVFSQFWVAVGARDATVKAYWHVVEAGHSAGLVDGKGAVLFGINWIFSPPLILRPLNHFLCNSISWFPSFPSNGRRVSHPTACTWNVPPPYASSTWTSSYHVPFSFVSYH